MILFKKVTFYLALISVVVMGIQVYRLQRQQPMPPPLVEPPAKPERTGIGASGLIEAIHDNINVGVPTPGVVTELYVDVGSTLHKDDPLFKIDDADLKAQLLVQQANLKVAQAQAARVQDQYQRVTSVKDPYAVTQGEVSARKRELDVANSQIAAAQASIEAAKVLIERTIVRSPIDGTVLQNNIAVGEFVSPQSQVPPLVIGNTAEVQVRADVDEQIAPRVKPGKNAVGYIKGEPDKPIQLEFVRIEPYVVPKRSLTGYTSERIDTRVLQVIFKFPNSLEHPVYVGQQMDLYIEE